MPPAGADPETWVPEEEPQPIGISVNLPHGSILPGANFFKHGAIPGTSTRKIVGSITVLVTPLFCSS